MLYHGEGAAHLVVLSSHFDSDLYAAATGRVLSRVLRAVNAASMPRQCCCAQVIPRRDMRCSGSLR